jgi:lipopolysaccharide export LptBFGC system permease protein LptF
MKIIMILGTGIFLTFPMDESVIPDCFSQGYDILKKISTYQDTGNRDQGWYLNGTKIHVTGFYCQ